MRISAAVLGACRRGRVTLAVTDSRHERDAMVRTTLLGIVLLLLPAAPLLAAPSDSGEQVVSEEAGAPEPEGTDDDVGPGPEHPEEVLIGLRFPLYSPLFADMPVATVEGEPITVRDLTRRISSVHAGRADGATQTRKNYARLLERVITTQLIVQEAINIGLDELEGVRAEIDRFSTQLAISTLMREELTDVEPDPADVEDLYGQMSREFLLTTLIFAKDEDARSFRGEYDAGGDFHELARRFWREGRASADFDTEEYAKLKDLLPQVAKVAFGLTVGSVSQIFRAPSGFVIFYVKDVRFYEDPGVREDARRILLAPLRKRKGREFGESLEEKYATVDQGLLDEITFEPQKTGFPWSRKETPVDYEKLLNDGRVLARVDDDEPFIITVGDLAQKLERAYFHGLEKAVRRGALDRQKRITLSNMLLKKIAKIEIRKRGIDQREEYLDALEEHENGVLFETFIRKVIAPDVEITEEKRERYYLDHTDDFATPAMFRMSGLVFHSLSDAENALDKLNRGADFAWVSANTPGQVDKDTPGVLTFDEGVLSSTALPGGLQRRVEEARQGDAILYTSPDDYHYVIAIRKVFPSTVEAYETARPAIGKPLYNAEIRALVEDWSAKLKEAYETRIFVTGFDE
jgi:hypothetical protein